MTQALRMLVLCLLAVLLPVGAQAAEEIRSYHADIAIGSDGTLDVTERIRVNVEGREIRRGIFRDIPLRFEDEAGRMREVGLDVISVTRNGAPEPYTTQRGSGMIRVRIGDADVLIPHGEHTYEIAYRTDRQIRFFEEHDELYWNVTGNAWDFAILEASVEVQLPGNAVARDVTYFTGRLGSTEQAATAERLSGGNRIRVTADRQLGPREGLTIAIAMPKNALAVPTAELMRAADRPEAHVRPASAASRFDGLGLNQNYIAALEGLFRPGPYQFTDASFLFLGGMSATFLESCGFPSRVSDRRGLISYHLSLGARVGAGARFADPSLSDAIGSQIEGSALIAAGGALAEHIGCTALGNELATAIAAAYRSEQTGPGGGDSRFVEGCLRRYSRQQCECLANTARAVVPGIHQSVFDDQIMQGIMERNPFIALQIVLTCGIAN